MFIVCVPLPSNSWERTSSHQFHGKYRFFLNCKVDLELLIFKCKHRLYTFVGYNLYWLMINLPLIYILCLIYLVFIFETSINVNTIIFRFSFLVPVVRISKNKELVRWTWYIRWWTFFPVPLMLFALILPLQWYYLYRPLSMSLLLLPCLFLLGSNEWWYLTCFSIIHGSIFSTGRTLRIPHWHPGNVLLKRCSTDWPPVSLNFNPSLSPYVVLPCLTTRCFLSTVRRPNIVEGWANSFWHHGLSKNFRALVQSSSLPPLALRTYRLLIGNCSGYHFLLPTQCCLSSNQWLYSTSSVATLYYATCVWLSFVPCLLIYSWFCCSSSLFLPY